MRLRSAWILVLTGLVISLTLSGCGGSGSSSSRPLPSVIEFSGAAFSVAETGTSVNITVSRVMGTAGAVAIDFATSDITATAGTDYTAASGSVGWASGDTADKTFTVAVSDDAFVEGDETVTLTLSNPTVGAALGTQTTAVLTILDDDTPAAGALQFNAPSYSFDEGSGTVTITITRSGGSSGAVSADFATNDNTAVNPADYISASGTLLWADGDAADKTFTVDIREDAIAEGNETIDLSLGNLMGGAVLGTQGASVISILDNDAFGSIEFSSSSYNISAYGGQIDITVRRVGGNSGVVTVNYAVTGNTATVGSDFTAPPGLLTWQDGDSADKTFTVTIVDDLLQETDETIDLALTNPTGGANLGTFDFATLTIQEGWVKDLSNPLLGPSLPVAFDDAGVMEPSVLGPASGLGQYSMWYTGDNQSTGIEQIGYASSPDGVNWTKFGTPVLSPGSPGSWDDLSVGAPGVLYDSVSGTFMMYFNGESQFGTIQIGLATSTDGTTWTKSPSNPVFGPGLPGAWDAAAVAFASVIDAGGTYKMWYTAVDVFSPAGVVRLGYATSPDGINWTRIPGPILSPTPGSFDALGVGFASVIQDGPTTFRMLYTGNLSVNGFQPMAVGYALSTNGGTIWTKYRNNVGVPVPVLDVGTPGAWDDGTLFGASWETIAPSQVWYQGEGFFGGSSVGLATHP